MQLGAEVSKLHWTLIMGHYSDTAQCGIASVEHWKLVYVATKHTGNILVTLLAGLRPYF